LLVVQSLSMIMKLAIESGNNGFGALVMKSIVKSSTTATLLTGENHERTSDSSDDARS